MKIALTICTRERPGMLQACLASVAQLDIPEDCAFHVVVVENGESESVRDIVTMALGGHDRLTFSYALEPVLGGPFVRNHSVELALESKPNWIGFVDDDETVPPDWLQAFVQAAQTMDADVFYGPVQSVPIQKPPAWYKQKPLNPNEMRGRKLSYAGTGNTLVRASWFDGRRMALRFDKSYRHTGGADEELFSRLLENGGVIRFVDDAIIRETVPAERLTMRWQFRRDYWEASCGGFKATRKKGFAAAFRGASPAMAYGFLTGTFRTGLALPLMLVWPRRGVKEYVKGRRKMNRALGMAAGLLGLRPTPYKTVDGF